jgi:hypothetical protein
VVVLLEAKVLEALQLVLQQQDKVILEVFTYKEMVLQVEVVEQVLVEHLQQNLGALVQVVLAQYQQLLVFQFIMQVVVAVVIMPIHHSHWELHLTPDLAAEEVVVQDIL